ncbi:AAA family ATPase [Streptococcus sobrinus]|uniref:AAA family ATPase n=1 Tax=Streptococcus sobrinus TaxID=1310 RepID=UPI0002D82654|nr:AAA family ATPase [Streptococcus sobrinus]AWN62543.1 anticodon nuclease [Streptococcus sobrinus]AWN64418.1 anticodon nuclease [Streptococcus sobrinus]OZV24490.1 anticodon nuclease [Streptococcus sobrinus]SQG19013.1 anticodon nuclease [Streptococcus sobrinus]
MGKMLEDIAQKLKDSNKKAQLIYAFNGTGKTRLSQKFKKLVCSNFPEEEDGFLTRDKILYYNAFTEDLFYWDNDLEGDLDFKLKIQDNSFIRWIIEDQGQDQNIIANFQRYTDDKLTPQFDLDNGHITFSFQRGNDEEPEQIKLSKGEGSNFVWSIFYTLLELVADEREIDDPDFVEEQKFADLEYVFIDDPVSSLDENHLIEVVSNLGTLIKSSNSDLKFIITTHNPLFFNVLYNELGCKQPKYQLEKLEDGTYELHEQHSDSPFSYHLFLLNKLREAIKTNSIQKFHFNLLRNLLEKTSTFLGYKDWKNLLPDVEERQSYEKRIIDFSSHSKHAADEVAALNRQEKQMLIHLVNLLEETYHFNKE